MTTLWSITLEALQPITIAQQISAESQWNTTSFIPGSTWRGALAEQWKYVAGFDHNLTNQLIEQSIFHDAYERNTVFTPIYIKEEKNTGNLVNMLPTYLKQNTFLATHNNKPLLEKSTYSSSVLKSANVGTEMSRTRESVLYGKLYTMTSIAEGTTFNTTATIPKEVVEVLAPNGFVDIYIGKKRFSGYGKTRVSFQKITQSHTITAQFDELQKYAPSKDVVVVALSAKSPLILFDDYLRPAYHIDWIKHVQPLLTEEYQQLTPLTETTWGIRQVRDGWQQQWNAPKPTELALSAGTTYIATFPIKSRQDVVKALEILLQKGLGERIQEGFGELILAPTSFDENSTQSRKSVQTQHGVFNDIEEAAIFKEAENFIQSLNKQISLSQWQLLISEPDPIYAITSENEMAYLEKRINSNVRNVWRAPSKNNPEKGNGYLLRRSVKKIMEQYRPTDNQPGRAIAAVRLFLQFNARITRMMKGVQ